MRKAESGFEDSDSFVSRRSGPVDLRRLVRKPYLKQSTSVHILEASFVDVDIKLSLPDRTLTLAWILEQM